jgi:hypothetical protein
MKYLITLIVIITQIFAGANLIVKTNNGSVTYPIIDITQLDFNQDLDIMYIHTATMAYYYSIDEIDTIEFDDELSVDEFKILSSFSLMQNYPNPFNPITTIRFAINHSDYAMVEIFDLRGRLIKTLLNKYMVAGKHSIQWDRSDKNGKNVTSGIYFYRLSVGGVYQSKKMILLK